MVSASEAGPSDTVLEIGPGLGMLTRELVQVAGQVVAVELDRELAAELPATLGNPHNLRVVHADALSAEFDQLVFEPYLTVASLPYHVATPILFKLLFHPPRPKRIVAMVQQEVALRIAGAQDSASYLSTAISLMADARIVRRVAPGSFFPVPKVWSAVVRLDVLDQPRAPVHSVDSFLEFLHAGFTQPRKQLHNSLGQGLGIPTDHAQDAALQVGIDPRRRPGSLTLAEWADLYRTIKQAEE